VCQILEWTFHGGSKFPFLNWFLNGDYNNAALQRCLWCNYCFHNNKWVSRGLTSHSTLYRSFRRRFLQVQQIEFLSHWDSYAVISLEAVAYSSYCNTWSGSQGRIQGGRGPAPHFWQSQFYFLHCIQCLKKIFLKLNFDFIVAEIWGVFKSVGVYACVCVCVIP